MSWNVYDAALSALRKSDYVASARGFQAYLTQYPDGALAPNAWYWLGESYYATQNYPIALQSFDTLLRQFPDSPKSADAMLKKAVTVLPFGVAMGVVVLAMVLVSLRTRESIPAHTRRFMVRLHTPEAVELDRGPYPL